MEEKVNGLKKFINMMNSLQTFIDMVIESAENEKELEILLEMLDNKAVELDNMIPYKE